MKDGKKLIYGVYNRQGYRVCTARGQELYFAGNSPHDSTAITDHGLPLKTIRAYCIETTHEFVEQLDGVYCGVDREDDYGH